jgi:hypothetical protein
VCEVILEGARLLAVWNPAYGCIGVMCVVYCPWWCWEEGALGTALLVGRPQCGRGHTPAWQCSTPGSWQATARAGG